MPPSVMEIDNRIAALEAAIRDLIEQATAAAGSENEARIADRIAELTEELETLRKVHQVAGPEEK